MRFAHIALGTRDASRSARFLESTLGWKVVDPPDDPTTRFVWLEIAPDQYIHLIEIEGFEISPYEAEYGRHFAFKHPANDYKKLQERLQNAGVEILPARRATPFSRFFFRTPDCYMFEIIEHHEE